MSTTPSPDPIDFDPSTLPWPDRDDFETELARRRDAGEVAPADEERLRHFRELGYVPFPALLDSATVDGLVDEHDRAWDEGWAVQALTEHRGVVDVDQLEPRQEFGHHHYRLLDLQDVSGPIRSVMLHPEIVGFLRLYFGEPSVAMQSLFFEYGSEQGTHQDFPYVQSQILSHLVGCWIACEDVTEDNGPLFYYPGSHHMPKFDWGGGALTFDNEDPNQIEEFRRHLQQETEAAGLERQTFHARRGDVFLWHGALAHGGSPSNDPEATRRSLVVHYSSRSAYPRDRRFPEIEPELLQANGGTIYLRPRPAALPFATRIKRKIKHLLGR